MKLYQLAALCASAYKVKDETEYQFCKRMSKHSMLAGHRLVCISEEGVEGFVAVNPQTKHATVVLRGTEELSDFIADIRAWRVRNPNGKGTVHAGVLRYLRPAWRTLVDIFADEGVVSIEFAGHSLGAMLSMLAAEWVLNSMTYLTLIEVTTFGSPPVGNYAFCESLRAGSKVKITHVVNCMDRVPRLLTPRLMLFKLCGTVIYIDRNKVITENPSWWFKLKDWVLWCWENKSLSTGLSFHNKEKYASILEELQI